ncbi:translation initiation factor eIF-1A [Candidatus Woesearchaeota archaeon]|nr:translation initiation factor eIF-1A [Candidatus Woesearchaeota archaeon]
MAFKGRGGRGKPQPSQTPEEEQEYLMRTPVPKGKEVFGIVEQRVGGSRMIVRCMDGKTRNCRIPGRLKKRLWVREGDLVVVEPWEFGGDEKGDVILKYRRNQVDYLRKKGYLRMLDEFEAF